MVAAKLKYELDEYTWKMFEEYDTDCIVFETEATKWYDSYDEVRIITEMFETFFHEGFDAAVKHIRVGEELEDNVEEVLEPQNGESPDWFYDIYITRSIATPWRA
jgi:hypothetical protein